MTRPTRSNPLPLILALAVSALSVPRAAGAHEFWFAPSQYRASAGDTIRIATFVGTGFRGERRPFARPRCIRFQLDGKRRLDLSVAATNGDLTWARLVTPDDGGLLVAYQSDFAAIELDGPAFDRYLELEGLDGPRAERAKRGDRGPGRERYARCPKTWIAGRDAARASRAAGTILELVPLSAPGAAPTLTVRLLYRGRPLPGALVRAWNRPLGTGWAPTDAAARDSVGPSGEARTGRDGVVRLDVSQPGEWLIGSVHMVRSGARDADWESCWASLTFARKHEP
jgi:hypothetical protein